MVKEGKKITGPEQLKDAAFGCARIRGDTLGIVGLGQFTLNQTLGIVGLGQFTLNQTLGIVGLGQFTLNQTVFTEQAVCAI